MDGADAASEFDTRKVHGSSAILPYKYWVDRFADASEELTNPKGAFW